MGCSGSGSGFDGVLSMQGVEGAPAGSASNDVLEAAGLWLGGSGLPHQLWDKLRAELSAFGLFSGGTGVQLPEGGADSGDFSGSTGGTVTIHR